MKRVLTSTLLLIIAVAIVPTAATRVGNSQTKTAGSQSQLRISVGVVVSPRMPISIGTTAATIADDQTVLQYALNNQAGSQLAVLEMLAFALDRSGRIKGGEGWTVRENLAESPSETFIRIMKTKLTAEDRLTLTVWRTSGEMGTLEVNETELHNMLRPRAAIEKQPLQGRLIKASLPEGEYCLDRLAVAEKSCGCGVKSFSCNPTNGEWSFTCYTKAESHAQCKQEEGESE